MASFKLGRVAAIAGSSLSAVMFASAISASLSVPAPLAFTSVAAAATNDCAYPGQPEKREACLNSRHMTPHGDCDYRDPARREACVDSRHKPETNNCAYPGDPARHEACVDSRHKPETNDCAYPGQPAKREACLRSRGR